MEIMAVETMLPIKDRKEKEKLVRKAKRQVNYKATLWHRVMVILMHLAEICFPGGNLVMMKWLLTLSAFTVFVRFAMIVRCPSIIRSPLETSYKKAILPLPSVLISATMMNNSKLKRMLLITMDHRQKTTGISRLERESSKIKRRMRMQ